MRPPGGAKPGDDDGGDSRPARPARPAAAAGEGAPPAQPDPAREGAQDRPEPPQEVSEAPLHPALVPRGEAIAWSALGSLLAGPVVWGGIGALADRVLGTGRILLVLGLVVGTVTGMWIVYVRFGQDDTGKPRS